jgi:hypothetical protein
MTGALASPPDALFSLAQERTISMVPISGRRLSLARTLPASAIPGLHPSLPHLLRGNRFFSLWFYPLVNSRLQMNGLMIGRVVKA